MRVEILNGVEYTVNEKIENFSIKSMPSSNVAFYGVSHDLGNKQIFVQFKNGSSYIYSNLTDDVIIALSECESIGKFVSSQIVGKFPSIKCESALVVPISKFPTAEQAIDALETMANSGKVDLNSNEEPTF